MKRVAIVGSRDFPLSARDFNPVFALLDMHLQDAEILTGDASGVDAWVRNACAFYNRRCKVYPALWKNYGRKAGVMRNRDMAEDCDQVICFWDGLSRGCIYTVDFARELGKPVVIVKPGDPCPLCAP